MTFGKQERTCLLKPATNQPLLLNNAVFYTHFSGYACPHKSAHTLIPPVSLNPVNSNNIVSRRSIMITGPAGACANQLLIQTRAQVVLLTPELMMRIAPAGNQPCKHQAVEQQRIKGSAPAGRGGGADRYLLHWFTSLNVKRVTGAAVSRERTLVDLKVEVWWEKVASCWQLRRLIIKSPKR